MERTPDALATAEVLTPDGAAGILRRLREGGVRTDVIHWTLDGEPYQTFTPADLPDGAPWVFDHPFFPILNVAVGNPWTGDPDPTTAFPEQQMKVDWVRVYSLDAVAT